MNENALSPIVLKILTVNTTSKTAILFFFGFICQNINSRVLRISQIGFSRQERSMSFERQFLMLDLNIGFADLLEARGGDQIQRKATIFAQRVSGTTGHVAFAFQLARPRSVFFWGGGHPNLTI